jgi:rSAM/selenodomain-associated transferase 1
MQNDFFSGSDSKNALGIFCRAPRLGEVKTRIAATRGDEFALGLYRAMLRDTFDLARQLAPEVTPFAIYTPDDAFVDEESFVDESTLNAFWNGPRLAQCDGDLGARMLDAFAQLRARGFERIALIGSDSPDLPLLYAQDAFRVLRQMDLTVGPSWDGGFYLIGASREIPKGLFDGIVWGGDEVYYRLRNIRIRMSNSPTSLTSATLAIWHDVDNEDDIIKMRHHLFKGNWRAPHTKAWLEQNP